MTNHEISRRSVVEEYESTMTGAVDLAVARAGAAVNRLLQGAFEASSMRAQDLADALGVSPARVSQIMASDETIKVATLARYLRTLGYALALDATPADPNGKPLPEKRARRRKPHDTFDIYAQAGENSEGLAMAMSFVPAGMQMSDFYGPSRLVASSANVDGLTPRIKRSWMPQAESEPQAANLGSTQ